ncbi:hypothetical protein RMSM_05273 [Rhodopirellula maiorica SM1]|uniref:Uncharacterized protein n=1 Tax=Rhodopirellula maiorica SM1 TaxID=1265738 RepID=M5RFE3_9BACT|nr:hypothetical protein RMSM_05273 [Rhodopirellula maiorica SM1]
MLDDGWPSRMRNNLTHALFFMALCGWIPNRISSATKQQTVLTFTGES